jgi:undecaprenyl-diphosphatase
MEDPFIINLQKSPHIVFKIMNAISFPFHLKFYSVIILILYYESIIALPEVLLLFVGQITVGLIKFLVKRKRPYNNNSKIKNKEHLKLDYYSFPSGHTFNAFLLFYILRNTGIINNNYKIIPYFVAISRVVLGVHYPTDVIGGAILAKLLFYLFEYNEFNLGV